MRCKLRLKIQFIHFNKYCLIAVHKTVHDFVIKKDILAYNLGVLTSA